MFGIDLFKRQAPPTGTMSSSGSLKQDRRLDLALCLLLVAICFLAHYWHFQSFGLYEDDYFFVAGRGDSALEELSAAIGNFFSSWTQGRPLGFSSAFFLSWLGLNLGGLPAVYLIGFAVVSCNTLLFYSLIQRQFGTLSAFLSSLWFILFPADTTRALLTHALALQPSLTFLLVACHLYLLRNKLPAYLAVGLTLITYESAFFPFIAAPLLTAQGKKIPLKSWFIHGAVLAFELSIFAVLRIVLGESRVTGALGNPLEVVTRALASMVIGTLTSISLCFFRLNTALEHLDFTNMAVVVPVAMLLSFALLQTAQRRARAVAIVDGGAPSEETDAWTLSVAVKPLISAQQLFSQVRLGALMLVTAYPLAFMDPHYPPTALAGRLTSVHFAATVGFAVLGGALLTLVMYFAVFFRQQLGFSLVIGGYFALLLQFGLYVQNDFEKSRQDQQKFWSEVVRLVPDLKEGSVILFEGSLPSSDGRSRFAEQYVERNSWADPLVLAHLYDFSQDLPGSNLSWEQQQMRLPRLYSLSGDWQQLVQVENGRFHYRGKVWRLDDQWERGLLLPSGNTILLRTVNGSLVRATGSILLDSRSFALKPPGAGQLPTKHKLLYDDLILDSKEFQPQRTTR